jgi:hypothetical protein
VLAFYYGVMTPYPVPKTGLSRRQFLGISLGWLLFWRRDRKKLAGIRFRVIRKGRSGRRFLLIHGNEQTAREVLTAYMPNTRGTAYLVENTGRNVEFRGGQLDPNRMYSREGAEKNLRLLNPSWREPEIQEALDFLDRRRRDVLNAVRPKDGDVLITVHNNSQGYSVRDEVPISNRIAMNDADSPHEFFLCTDERDFELLSRGPYNVVLQNRTDAADDGSLSRFAAREGFRYVNLEAALGKFDVQRTMLEWLDKTLPHA